MIATTLDVAAIVDAAERVTGWMTRKELTWLAQQAATHDRILEVGSYRGRSTVALAMAALGVVHCVDDFRGEEGTPDWHGDKLAEAFIETIRDAGVYHVVSLWRMTFAEMAGQCDDGTFDMIFIDGTHEPAEAVADDCRIAQRLLLPGGLICGHDWTVGDVMPGVHSVFPDAYPVPETETIWAVPR